jgi:NAD+ kinase
VVVHPARDIDDALGEIRQWARDQDADVVQVAIPGQDRRVAELGETGDCGLVLAIGGDGTTLAALRAAATAGRPVLGVACGSLGVLTSVTADEVSQALDRFAAGNWSPRGMPALNVQSGDGDTLFALNDIALLRRGEGQVTTAAYVDDVLYARFVGDGFVISTPVGSSAYTLAAGGPLLSPGTPALALTPLSAHGGSCPPLVVGTNSELRLDITAGYGGVRLEVDGRVSDLEPESLTVSFADDMTTLVELGGEEPPLTVLRRRQIILDSPRVLARDSRTPED